MTYAQLADAIVKTGILSDPWLNGDERFRLEPIVLTQDAYARLCDAAEAIGKAYHELAKIVWNAPTLLDDFFHLTPFQKLMWFSSGGMWHVIARLDAFLTSDGRIQICEMNSDTPSGEAEAVLLNELLQQENLTNPNADFERAFCDAVFECYRRNASQIKPNPTIAIVYPTDLPEDLSMIELYRRWFEKRGSEVVLGAPQNLRGTKQGSVALFGREVDILIRHYKTDWWGERESAWLDGEAFLDPDPLSTELLWLIEAERKGKLCLVNPFGAVLTQNKLSLAFLWAHLDKFSAENQNAIRAHIPKSLRLCDVADARALRKDDWVLKSDYGCEGEEVIVGKDASEEVWREALRKAKPTRWILQRYFDAEKDGEISNFGIYLVAGRASGVFARVSKSATDGAAKCAATFVKP
ncbi:MAG: glutathionylspermidine synthase family protein [Chloroherpetonaceae bacterium]|nr:glutathionylspermidine synthase family protein [Chloroherpetonaceae bacterium]